MWTSPEAFYGKPWVWNVLHNFGGKVSLYGGLPKIAANLDSVLRSPDQGSLTGIGMTMEGFGYNPIVPDFVTDMTWRDSVPPLDVWTRDYITRRYGAADAHAWHAWQLLLATAYRSGAQTGNFLAERPQFYVKGTRYRSEPIPPYDPRMLAQALDSLLAAAPALGGSDAYRYDVVNLARQVLGELGLPLVNRVQDAFDRKDLPALHAAEDRVLELLGDLDALVGTRREFLLGIWLADARRWGTTDAERRLYEWNARNIITLWGTKCTEGQNDDLNLYAYKEWQGMFTSYFLPRWRAFFDQLNQSLATGVPSTGHRSRRRCARGSSAGQARPAPSPPSRGGMPSPPPAGWPRSTTTSSSNMDEGGRLGVHRDAPLRLQNQHAPLESGQVEAIQVHHLGPRRHEVAHELLLRVGLRVHLRERAELRVRPEDEVHAGGRPLDVARLAIAPLEHVLRVRGRLPRGAHVEQVHEEVVGERLRRAW